MFLIFASDVRVYTTFGRDVGSGTREEVGKEVLNRGRNKGETQDRSFERERGPKKTEFPDSRRLMDVEE